MISVSYCLLQTFLQLFVVLAVVNPFCCCDSVASVFGASGGEEPISHGCCGGETENGVPQENGHDRSSCEHQVGNGYIQSSIEQIHAVAHEVDIQAPVEPLYDFFDLWLPSAVLVHSPPVREGIGSRSAVRLHQVDCIYLI